MRNPDLFAILFSFGRTRILCCVIVAIICHAGSDLSDAAVLRFEVIALGAVESTVDSGKAINDAGTVAFTVSTAVNLWQNGVATTVPNLFANNGPLDINDGGNLAGAERSRAFFYQNGIKTDLGTFGRGPTFARGLNNNDLVVGESYDNSVLRYRAFKWQSGNLQRLPAPGGIYAPGAESRAGAINASGAIAGSYNNQNPGGVAVVWKDGVATALTTLAGYDRSEGLGINDAGQVVGYSADAHFVQGHAVLWNGTTPTDLGSLPGLRFGRANAINSQAMVVGSARPSNGGDGGSAFLWLDGEMFDLNSLISPTSGWHLTSAMDINDRGEIVGYGTLHNAGQSFLLVPVPEPSSVALLSLGGLAFLARRPRFRRAVAVVLLQSCVGASSPARLD